VVAKHNPCHLDCRRKVSKVFDEGVHLRGVV